MTIGPPWPNLGLSAPIASLTRSSFPPSKVCSSLNEPTGAPIPQQVYLIPQPCSGPSAAPLLLGSPGWGLLGRAFGRQPSSSHHHASHHAIAGGTGDPKNASMSERYSPAKCPVGEVTACGWARVTVQSTVASGLSPAAGPWSRDGDRAPSTSPLHLRGHRWFTEPWEVLGLPVPWPCPGSCSRSFCHIFRGLFFYIGCNLQLGMSHQVAPLRAAPQTPTAPRGTGAPASPVPCGATGSCAALGRTGTHQPGRVRPGHGQHRGLCGWVILFSELHPVSPPCAMPVQGPDGNYFLSGQSVACQMRESG